AACPFPRPRAGRGRSRAGAGEPARPPRGRGGAAGPGDRRPGAGGAGVSGTGVSAGIRPHIGLSRVVVGKEEERLVLQVLRSGMLAQGPMVARLEDAFAKLAGTAHAVAVSSGTVALVATLEALGVGPGDEVVTSPLTFAATLNAILQVGATARFADVGDDLTMDPARLARVLDRPLDRPARAVLPVHLYGY